MLFECGSVRVISYWYGAISFWIVNVHHDTWSDWHRNESLDRVRSNNQTALRINTRTTECTDFWFPLYETIISGISKTNIQLTLKKFYLNKFKHLDYIYNIIIFFTLNEEGFVKYHFKFWNSFHFFGLSWFFFFSFCLLTKKFG